MNRVPARCFPGSWLQPPPVLAKAPTPAAFTLVEMLAVLALAAILAGIVTVSMIGTMRAARADDVAGQIATFDRLTRESCRRMGKPSRLLFDLDRGTVTRTDETKSGGVLHLPWGFRIACIATADVTQTSGVKQIACSIDGQTPSYAIELTDVRNKQYWIVTAGLTGMTTRVSDEQEVQDIFAALRHSLPAGDDAH